MKKKPKALITGITGQDGSYLSRILLEKGYDVIGTSRDKSTCDTNKLKKVGTFEKVKIISLNLSDFQNVLNIIKEINPRQIYNLGGLTSVSLSFEQPLECIESITKGTLNILEAIRFLNLDCKFLNCGSSECYGHIRENDQPANELSNFKPRSPYAIAKAAAHWYVKNYREAYGIKCVNAILSNHESPLRPERFVLKKIIKIANEIKNGTRNKITLGDISIIRDWGYAEEYMNAAFQILENGIEEDFNIATGKSYSLEQVAKKIFEFYDLDLNEYIAIDKNLFRPYEIPRSALDASKIYKKIGWKAKYSINELVNLLCKQFT